MMKKTRFKKQKLTYKEKTIIVIMITISLCIYITFIITMNINKKIIYSSEKLILAETDKIYNNSFNLKEINTNNLINIIKNSKEEIIEVDFDINECEKILTETINRINSKTNNYLIDGYIINVPIGYITNSPLLINLGPKIPIKISIIDVVYGNVKTNIKEYGINNALIEIYIQINLKVNSSLPIIQDTYNYKYTYLLASKIINGKVPDFYGGLISKNSDTINLPITENL